MADIHDREFIQLLKSDSNIAIEYVKEAFKEGNPEALIRIVDKLRDVLSLKSDSEVYDLVLKGFGCVILEKNGHPVENPSELQIEFRPIATTSNTKQ